MKYKIVKTKDWEELLDALQHVHRGNARYARSQRIKILVKHGRINLPEERNV